MSPKKKKAPEAQNLIDSLLDDEKTTTAKDPKADYPQTVTSFPKTGEREVPEFTAPKHTGGLKIDVPKPLPDIDITASLGKFGIPAKDKDHDNENTVRIDEFLAKKKSTTSEAISLGFKPETAVDRMSPTDVKTTIRLQQEAMRAMPSSAVAFSAEATLKQSESLRIAQGRISVLEQELERIRRENEQLASAGETLRRRADELLSKSESSEVQARESAKIFEEEKKVFRGQLQQKDREIHELRQRTEEMELRLESNFKKIRVRERELEHRLEIIKMESATLVSTKDQMILELKRQLDQLTHENDFGKQKTQELFNQYKDKQETARRVVRALRIALTILEGDDDNPPSGGKKSE